MNYNSIFKILAASEDFTYFYTCLEILSKTWCSVSFQLVQIST